MPVDQLITLLIAEDNEITRIGLELTTSKIIGVRIVGVVADGIEAVDQAIKLRPNIVLMDDGLPNLDGIEATKRIKSEVVGTRVIMLSLDDTDETLFAALSAGADGYCVKELSISQLEMAIKSVADGAVWLDPGVSNRVLSAFANGVTLPDLSKSIRIDSPLSQREMDVLRLVIEGFSNQEIAVKLGLSIETIKTHMRHIMEKLAVTDRTQAAVKAMRQGLI